MKAFSLISTLVLEFLFVGANYYEYFRSSRDDYSIHLGDIAVFGGASLLMRNGVYGLALFMTTPLILGAVAECFRKSATGGRAAKVGALTVLVANCALLVLGLEGVICIVMAIPLTLPLGALGGYVAYVAGHA